MTVHQICYKVVPTMQTSLSSWTHLIVVSPQLVQQQEPVGGERRGEGGVRRRRGWREEEGGARRRGWREGDGGARRRRGVEGGGWRSEEEEGGGGRGMEERGGGGGGGRGMEERGGGGGGRMGEGGVRRRGVEGGEREE